MKWISAGDIKYWVTAKRRHCEETLPELIRRLICATAETVDRIDFPSGDSVTTGGWDGRLNTPSVSPFFPGGVSGWEMGVDGSPGVKAERDYATRTADPGGLKPEESTFVFVTPRPWPRRHDWEAAKRQEGVWKDVRTIAASELESWLESAPSVARWLGRQLGKTPGVIRDLESVWDEWAAATDPVMIPDVVSAGRAEQVQRVHQWLAAAPGVLELQGDAPDEVRAFLFAAIAQQDEPARTKSLSRCLVVEDIAQLRACLDYSPLVIVAPAECREAVGHAIQKSHHVLLTADSNAIDFRGRLVLLSRPRRDMLEAALHKNGFADADAHCLARDSGASIPVLRRRVFRASIGAPAWARPDSARLLLPPLLAGAWKDGQAGDQAILKVLTGRSEFATEFEPLLSVPDAPLRKFDNVWMLKSPLDAWFLLAHNLDAEHLARFRRAAVEALGEVHPKYELDPGRRWAAAMYGRQPRHSNWIRQGLAQTLVLLGVHGNRTTDPAATDAANAVTRDVLARAETWQSWSSLKDITPLLAEAAPETFMDALDNRLRNDAALFIELMKDNGTTFGECRHVGLLWALEGLAWEPAYFHRAVSILASLTEIDPGGSWGNRPVNSLRNVFLPREPQTYASPALRLAAFDALSDRSPELAWRVAEGTMRSAKISAAHQFRWRAYAEQRQPLDRVSPESYREYVQGMLPRIDCLIAATPANLIAAVKDFVRVEVARGAIMRCLAQVDLPALSADERDRLSANLRSVLHWINTYADSEIRQYVPDLAMALERLAPADLLERHGWLLGSAWPSLPEGEPKEPGERERLVTERREAAARVVLDNVELTRILDYASRVEHVGAFGHALGKVVRDEEEDERVLNAAMAREPVSEPFVVGYATGRVESAGREWVSKCAARLQASGSAPEAIARLYLSLREDRRTWTEIAGHGAAVESAYWKRVTGRPKTSADEAAMAVGKLLDADRPDAAVSIAGHDDVSLPSELLQRLLGALLTVDPRKSLLDGTMFRYHLGRVFAQLYDRAELSLEDVAMLEWPFAQILGDEAARVAGGPLAIHRLLDRDPSFFALMVSLVYKRDDRAAEPHDERIPEERREAMVGNARQVLRSWRRLPGLTDDGSLDGKALSDWVEAARTRCAETSHVVGGDIEIAEIFARSPSDAAGVWPHPVVRDIIEALRSEAVDEHLPVAVYNNRGVSTRGIFDGGTQEHTLAAHYDEMSKALSAKWPRTAAVLGTIARSYRLDARQEDMTAELRDVSRG
jgi:hypothetical protein